MSKPSTPCQNSSARSRSATFKWTCPISTRGSIVRSTVLRSRLPRGAFDHKEAVMAWNIEGSYFETCSCDLMCPCNMSFDHGATYDYCRVTLVFNIREGNIEGTDVSGLKVAAIADTPKVMTEGNWRLGLFIDDNATDEQMQKLTAVFGGQ